MSNLVCVALSFFAVNLKIKRGLFLCCLFFSLLLAQTPLKVCLEWMAPQSFTVLQDKSRKDKCHVLNGPSHTRVCLQSLSYLSLKMEHLSVRRERPPSTNPNPPAGRPKPEGRQKMHASLSTPTPYPCLSTIHSNTFVSMMCACSGE